MYSKKIKNSLNSSIKVKQAILADEELVLEIGKIAQLIIDCFNKKGKILLCGNGGSASDAQHIAAEFTGRYYLDRPPLNAEALHTDTSFLTAVANDYSFDEIYSRMIEAKGRKSDILIGISTSGNSENVIRAVQKANKMGLVTIVFVGGTGGKLKKIGNHIVNIPSNDTPRIQESHITIGHIICDIVEQEMFGEKQ